MANAHPGRPRNRTRRDPHQTAAYVAGVPFVLAIVALLVFTLGGIDIGKNGFVLLLVGGIVFAVTSFGIVYTWLSRG